MSTDPSERAVADELRAQADRLSTLADDLARIEEVTDADEISYRIREGEIVVVRLAYHIDDAGGEGG